MGKAHAGRIASYPATELPVYGRGLLRFYRPQGCADRQKSRRSAGIHRISYRLSGKAISALHIQVEVAASLMASVALSGDSLLVADIRAADVRSCEEAGVEFLVISELL